MLRLSVAPLDSINISVPDTVNKMRGSVVSCEIRRELYLCCFAFGAVWLKYTEFQAAKLVFNVPLTVTTTMFPTLQTTVGNVVILQSINTADTEYLLVYREHCECIPVFCFGG